VAVDPGRQVSLVVLRPRANFQASRGVSPWILLSEVPMDAEFSWPRAGDVLFSGDGDWFNACVGWTRDQWVGYIEGYKLAADLLVQHVADEQRNQDFLIYPIVFLYRQAVEVSLKHLIWVGSQLQDKRPEQKPKPNHLLVQLWRQCRPIIEDVWPDGPKQDLDAVGTVLDQFEARDPNSTVCRYPVTKEGRASLSVNERIDIRNFAEVVNGVLALLDGCACEFSEYLQNKLEYEWEMEREYAEYEWEMEREYAEYEWEMEREYAE